MQLNFELVKHAKVSIQQKQKKIPYSMANILLIPLHGFWLIISNTEKLFVITSGCSYKQQ